MSKKSTKKQPKVVAPTPKPKGEVVAHPSSKGKKAPAKPPLIDVVCRKVQLTMALEQTADGEFAGEFKPMTQQIPEVDFDTPINLRQLTRDLCREVKKKIEKGTL